MFLFQMKRKSDGNSDKDSSPGKKMCKTNEHDRYEKFYFMFLTLIIFKCFSSIAAL